MIDIEQVRADTPGVTHCNHMNNASASLMPLQVIATVSAFQAREIAIGSTTASSEFVAEVNAVYNDVARLIGAQPHEIAMAPSATAAWQKAFYAIELGPGDVVLTGEAEYGANCISFLQRQRRDGFDVRVVPSTECGELDVARLEAMIDRNTKLIALTWLPTNGGLINPAHEVGRIARAAGVAYLLDACQAVGHLHVNVDEIGCDFLSAAGRKFLRAPRGTGFLYVSDRYLDGERTLEPPMMDHCSAHWSGRDTYEVVPTAKRFELYEQPHALQLGLGEAARYALAIGLDQIEARTAELGAYTRARLSDIKGVSVRDIGSRRSAIVTCELDGADPSAIKAGLASQAIHVNVSPPASTRYDSERRRLGPLLRLSPHYFNTQGEIDAAASALDQMLRRV